ncbi:hypothetical protein QBC39DRAFT_337731 [Podospora conica]|nr:hypothetical protein QBC39DRAFT_337731 [Schizothecium conicum]
MIISRIPLLESLTALWHLPTVTALPSTTRTRHSRAGRYALPGLQTTPGTSLGGSGPRTYGTGRLSLTLDPLIFRWPGLLLVRVGPKCSSDAASADKPGRGRARARMSASSSPPPVSTPHACVLNERLDRVAWISQHRPVLPPKDQGPRAKARSPTGWRAPVRLPSGLDSDRPTI